MENVIVNKKTIWIIFSIIGLLLIIIPILSYNNGYNSGNNSGYELGQTFGDSTGFVRGFNTKFDDLYKIDSAFNEIKAQFLPNVNYVSIVNSVATVGQKKKSYVEFKAFMDTINLNMIHFLSDNLDVSDRDRTKIINRYNSQSSGNIADDYEELVNLSNTRIDRGKKKIISRNNYENVNNLDKVLTKNFCRLTSLVTAEVSEVPITSMLVGISTRELCAYITGGIAKSFVAELKKMAIVKDYDQSKLALEKQVKSMIVELGTSEFSQESIFDQDFETEVDFLLFSVPSRADVTFKANSVTKAGFDLRKYFELNIDHGDKKIEILFPDPEILSHEVSFEAQEIDEGWAIDIDKEKINFVMKSAVNSLRTEAIGSNLLPDAKDNAEEIIRTIFQPIALSNPYPYSVILKFGNDERVLWDFSDEDYSLIFL